jgi:hypothetical protein
MSIPTGRQKENELKNPIPIYPRLSELWQEVVQDLV